jgi:hypothetical protein
VSGPWDHEPSVTFARELRTGYSSGMSGAHRSTTQSSVVAVSKSMVWLLKVGGVATAMVAQVAVVAFVGYTLITQPSKAWPVPLAVAFGITACLAFLADIVWRRAQRATRKP